MRVCVARTHEFGWLVASCDASVGMTRTDAVRRSEMGWPRRVGVCVCTENGGGLAQAPVHSHTHGRATGSELQFVLA